MEEVFGVTERIDFGGALFCGEDPIDAHIQLIEKDRLFGFFLDPDDLLDEVYSRDGRFEVHGSETEIGNTEPVLRIIHSCDRDHILEGCKVVDEFDLRPYVNLAVLDAELHLGGIPNRYKEAACGAG